MSIFKTHSTKQTVCHLILRMHVDINIMNLPPVAPDETWTGNETVVEV